MPWRRIPRGSIEQDCGRQIPLAFRQLPPGFGKVILKQAHLDTGVVAPDFGIVLVLIHCLLSPPDNAGNAALIRAL
jgi:hypothetical protein